MLIRSFRSFANKLSDRNRTKKYNFFMSFFKPAGETKILDVGASENEYQENANIIEKKYKYPENITVLGVEHFNEFSKRYPKVRIVEYGGGHFPFNDKEFDICWSNAVLEHVKPGEGRERFIKEIHRTAKAAFVTTPNRHFPFEVHTRLFLIHWFPKKIFDKILEKTSNGWATGDYMNLMTYRDIVKLLEKCGIKKYKIVKNRILLFIVDFVIIF